MVVLGSFHSQLFDADKDEIQNKYIRQLHTSIYSSNTTHKSNWSFKEQSQWERGVQVLIAAIWNLSKGKTKMHTFQSTPLNCIKMEFSHTPQSMHTLFQYNKNNPSCIPVTFHCDGNLHDYMWQIKLDWLNLIDLGFRRVQIMFLNKRNFINFLSEGKRVIKYHLPLQAENLSQEVLHIPSLPESYPLSSTDSNCSLKISPLSLCPVLVLFLFWPFQANRTILWSQGYCRTKRAQPLHSLSLVACSYEDLGIEAYYTVIFTVRHPG